MVADLQLDVDGARGTGGRRGGRHHEAAVPVSRIAEGVDGRVTSGHRVRFAPGTFEALGNPVQSA